MQNNNLQKLKLILTAIVVICLSPSVSAQQIDWVNGIGGIGADIAYGIAMDAVGNVYATGQFFDTVDFDAGTGMGKLIANGSSDIFIAKYDASGNYVWAKNIGSVGSSGNIGYSIAATAIGDTYITGYFTDTTDFDPGPNTFNLSTQGGSDIFVAKYDANANFLWAISMGGTSADYGRSIAIDPSGNVYVTGNFMGTADFDPGSATENLSSNGLTNAVFIAKYNSNGNYVWAKNIGGLVSTDIIYSYAIAANASGEVCITGKFRGDADFDPGTGTVNLSAAGSNDDIFIAKYDINGNYLWATCIGAPLADAGYGIDLDDLGNMYVTGNFRTFGTVATADFDPGPNTAILTSVSNGTDAFIAKYDPNGNYVWAKSIGGSSTEKGSSIRLDGTGKLYITGYFGGTCDFDPDTGTANLSAGGPKDVFLAFYDTSGNYVWAGNVGGAANDEGHSIAVDAAGGNLYITGTFEGTADFDPGAGSVLLNSGGNTDIFILKMQTGNAVCSPVFNGFTETACNSYTFNGTVYTTSGTYVDTFMTIANCDSIVTLNLTVIDTVWNSVTDTACYSYSFNGQTYTASGNYVQAFTGFLGCDSIITLNLTILDTVWHTISDTACYSYQLNGQSYTSSGSYSQALTSSLGCDSIVVLDLIIRDSSFNPVVTGHYCDSVVFNGITYTQSGTHIQNYTNTFGCDSSVVYDITIGQSNTAQINVTACDSFILDSVYTQSGSYQITFTNAEGCDSIVALDLMINNSPVASIAQTGNTLTAGVASSYQWVDCDELYTPVSGATDQVFSPEQSGNYAVIVTENDCSDTSDCVFVEVEENSIQEIGAGNYISLYPNPAGETVIIRTEQRLENATLLLKNLLGQTLSEKTNRHGKMFTIDLSGYASGIYLVDIKVAGESVTLKLLKR